MSDGRCPRCGLVMILTDEVRHYSMVIESHYCCPLCSGMIPSVHLNADKNLKPETAEALGEMIRYAYIAMKQGKLGKKKK